MTTKFIESLKIQIDLNRHVRPIPPKVLMQPINVNQDYCTIEHQNRYRLSLNWNVEIWINKSASDIEVQEARKDAMAELSRLIYSEIEYKIHEAKYFLRYGENEKAIQSINEIINLLNPKT